MKKLKVNLENCYGIKKLENDFDFSTSNIFAIYAPNGVMKTSFAKTFDDYVNGRDSNEKVFGYQPYIRSIADENDNNLPTDDIFVIKSLIDTEYTSDNISTLLVRNELREEYDKTLKSLEDAKNSILKTLKAETKSTDSEKEIKETFKDCGDNLFEIFNGVLEDVSKNKYRIFPFKYNDIFDNKVASAFIEKNKDNLQLYHDTYFDILQSSDEFFSKDGTFGTAQATDVAEAVSGDAFFTAGHKINLKNAKIISSASELNDLIDSQIEKVINDPKLKSQFEKIDKALRPKNMQSFKEIIEKDKTILLELVNYGEFRRKYWKGYFTKLVAEIDSLNKLYLEKKTEIERIILEANNESGKWKDTIEIFKKRFIGLPFEVYPKNTKDSVLGLYNPELGFRFIDSETGALKEIERNFLTGEILSQGEKRAFYILNIIFEIRARLEENKETLFIIDDIADSFDYKNKYAIVEYLKDLSSETNFHSIILTHNFDFFRTLYSRILIGGSRGTHALIAEKVMGEIRLISAEDKNVMDPFDSWKRSVGNNEKHLIACVPFVRNLIQFKDGISDDGYGWLTNILHKKEKAGDIKKTDDICIIDIEPIFKDVLNGITFTFPDATKKIIDVIDEQVANIKMTSAGTSMVLEDKIILAIGIRLKAEEYMWSKVSDKSPINGSQTGRLFGKYKSQFLDDLDHSDAIKTLERVNIMTPENIHLNSFMYEPILDMSIDELKGLHDEVALLAIS